MVGCWNDMNDKLLKQNRQSNQSTNHLSDQPRHRKPQRRFQARQNNDADHVNKESTIKVQESVAIVEDPSRTKKESCHAQLEEKCHAYAKLGHFAKHCLSKAQQNYQDEEFAYVINSSTNPPETRITVENGAFKVIVDKLAFKEMQKKNPNIRVQSSHKKVFPYETNTPLELIGEFEAQITASSGTTQGTFLVTNTNSTCLIMISYKKSIALGLLSLKVCSVSVDHLDPDVSAVLNKHKKVFEGMVISKTMKLNWKLILTFSQSLKKQGVFRTA
ncbi:Hypothetical predicted protein [Paramuricea clavata]|uniref:Uncharacterized protein n=1 Tax=Paramuricea clavata TaxID=317549 RepID=A0A6S7IGE2_PARCT|nr:Hypothetical predicted protein [Paramuricea clavata]